MRNIEKNSMQYKLGLYRRYDRHQSVFIDVLKKLINTVPNDVKDKLSTEAPLAKLINTINFKDFHLRTYLNPQKLSKSDEMHLFYKEQVAVELEIHLDADDLFKLTIIETLCATPNTRDEEKYFNWYPFKSCIVTYVDFNEQFFNILMKVENGRITFLVRDDDSERHPYDKELVSAVSSNFKDVLVPKRFR